MIYRRGWRKRNDEKKKPSTQIHWLKKINISSFVICNCIKLICWHQYKSNIIHLYLSPFDVNDWTRHNFLNFRSCRTCGIPFIVAVFYQTLKLCVTVPIADIYPYSSTWPMVEHKTMRITKPKKKNKSKWNQISWIMTLIIIMIHYIVEMPIRKINYR